MKRAVIVFLLLLLGQYAHSAPADFAHADKAHVVIEAYVAKHKGWPRADYRVEKKPPEHGHDIYWVIYIPDTLRSDIILGPVERKSSFIAIYDVHTHRIVKERRFQ